MDNDVVLRPKRECMAVTRFTHMVRTRCDAETAISHFYKRSDHLEGILGGDGMGNAEYVGWGRVW